MMNKPLRVILTLVLIQLSMNAMAQFRKPLSKPQKQSDEAAFNIGIIAGPSVSHWHHFNVSQAEEWYLEDYTPKLKLGYTGGLYFEAIVGRHLTVGASALYTKHIVNMQYVNDQYPYDWDNGLLYLQRAYDVTADYQSVSLMIPVSYYFLKSKDPIRPYVYAAPRLSYIFQGEITKTVTDTKPGEQPVSNSSSADLCPLNHTALNVGATAGLGLQFRISMDYYYFLIKTEALASWYFLNSYSKEQFENELINNRQDADAAVTITFIFPLKKVLHDACYNFRR